MAAVITRVVLNAGAASDWDAVMRDRMGAAESADGWIGGSVLAPEDDRHARGESDRRESQRIFAPSTPAHSQI